MTDLFIFLESWKKLWSYQWIVLCDSMVQECFLGNPYCEHPESEYGISIIISFLIPETHTRKILKMSRYSNKFFDCKYLFSNPVHWSAYVGVGSSKVLFIASKVILGGEILEFLFSLNSIMKRKDRISQAFPWLLRLSNFFSSSEVQVVFSVWFVLAPKKTWLYFWGKWEVFSHLFKVLP